MEEFLALVQNRGIDLPDEKREDAFSYYVAKRVTDVRQLEDDRLMDLLGGKSILKKVRPTDSRKRRRRYCFICKQDVDDAKGCFIKHCKMHLREHTDRVLLVECM